MAAAAELLSATLAVVDRGYPCEYQAALHTVESGLKYGQNKWKLKDMINAQDISLVPLQTCLGDKI